MSTSFVVSLVFLCVLARAGAVHKLQYHVGYEVRLRHDATYTDHAVFKFDDVVYNKGQGYRKGSGIFTVPVSGAYFLWAHIMRNDRSWMTVQIQTNKKLLVNGYITAGTYVHGVASVSGLFHLRKGEHVWVSKVAGRDVSIRGALHSSYGGMLMWPE